MPSPSQTAAEPGRALQAGEVALRASADQADARRLQARLGCDHKAVLRDHVPRADEDGRATRCVSQPGACCAGRSSSSARTRCSRTSTSAACAHWERGTRGPARRGGSPSRPPRTGRSPARRTCCSGSTRTCRTTCRSCSPGSACAIAEATLAEARPRPRQPRARPPATSRWSDRSASATTRTCRLTNPTGVPADDVAGLEIVREWREQVWRNAERLVNANSDAERAAIAAEIQSLRRRVGTGDRRRPRSRARANRATPTALGNRRLSAAASPARCTNMCS